MQLESLIELQARAKARPIRVIHIVNKLQTQLQNQLNEYDAGRITAKRFETRVKDRLARAYEEAYSAGSNGYVDDDYIQQQLEKEYGFLRSMFRDITTDQTRMPLNQRLGMYADKVSSVYDAGMVRDRNNKKLIIWNLGPTDKNCEDCIRMADGSPYTSKTLHTYPRSGDTRCLTNCMCWLSFE